MGKSLALVEMLGMGSVSALAHLRASNPTLPTSKTNTCPRPLPPLPSHTHTHIARCCTGACTDLFRLYPFLAPEGLGNTCVTRAAFSAAFANVGALNSRNPAWARYTTRNSDPFGNTSGCPHCFNDSYPTGTFICIRKGSTTSGSGDGSDDHSGSGGRRLLRQI